MLDLTCLRPRPRPCQQLVASVRLAALNMDMSNKDFSRAKYRLAQSRKRGQKRRGHAGDTARQRHEESDPDRLNVQEDEHALGNQDHDVAVFSDRVDLQSLLDASLAAHSTSSYQRHGAMMESLLQQGKLSARLMQDDVV